MSRESVHCPHCECGYCPVLETVQREVRWRGKIHVHTRRYRMCNHCGWRFTTVETLEDENNLGFPLAKNPDPPIPKKAPEVKRKRNPYLRGLE